MINTCYTSIHPVSLPSLYAQNIPRVPFNLDVERSFSAFERPLRQENSESRSGTLHCKTLMNSPTFEGSRVSVLGTPSRERELEFALFSPGYQSPFLNSPLRGSRLQVYMPQLGLEREASLSEVPDLYAMLKCTLLSQDNKENYKMAFKRALEPYTIVTTTGMDPKKMIKIVGDDYRISQSPKRTSTQAYNDNKPFSVSRDGMECLCEIIKEDIAIRYFMFIAKPERGSYLPLESDQVGDDAVRILAYNLPRDRFHMIKIGGAFGNEAALDLLNQIPYLLRASIQNPMIHIYGAGITEKEICDRCSYFASLDPHRKSARFF